MGLFRRSDRGPARTAEAIRDFLEWWSRVRDDVAAALGEGTADSLASVLAPRVSRIHPDLEWETLPGRSARHALVVCAGGRPELRSVAERWHRAGPEADDLWEHHPARQPDPGGFTSSLEVAGRSLDLSRTVLAARADDTRCRLDVQVHHPDFPDLPDEARTQVSCLVLDWALGEDDVERWVGEITPLSDAPLDPVPASSFGLVVEQLRERWSREQWALLQGEGRRGRPLLAAARHPMLRVDHPLFDEHVAVTLSFPGTPQGLPTEEALAHLRAFEDHLLSRLGDAAVLVAHETHDGRRLLHLYDDGEASVAPQVEAVLPAYRGGRAQVRVEPDPAWRATSHLRP